MREERDHFLSRKLQQGESGGIRQGEYEGHLYRNTDESHDERHGRKEGGGDRKALWLTADRGQYLLVSLFPEDFGTGS